MKKILIMTMVALTLGGALVGCESSKENNSKPNTVTDNSEDSTIISNSIEEKQKDVNGVEQISDEEYNAMTPEEQKEFCLRQSAELKEASDSGKIKSDGTMLVKFDGEYRKLALLGGMQSTDRYAGRICGFVMNHGDQPLYTSLINMKLEPQCFVEGSNNENCAIAFKYKNEYAVLKIYNNKFKFAIGEKEITDEKTLNGVSSWLFGECYNWENINDAIINQEAIRQSTPEEDAAWERFSKTVQEDNRQKKEEREYKKILDEAAKGIR